MGGVSLCATTHTHDLLHKEKSRKGEGVKMGTQKVIVMLAWVNEAEKLENGSTYRCKNTTSTSTSSRSSCKKSFRKCDTDSYVICPHTTICLWEILIFFFCTTHSRTHTHIGSWMHNSSSPAWRSGSGSESKLEVGVVQQRRLVCDMSSVLKYVSTGTPGNCAEKEKQCISFVHKQTL